MHTKESEEDAQNEGNHSAFRRICRAHGIDIRVCVDVVDMQMDRTLRCINHIRRVGIS